jgi:hypothetical protein
VADDLSTGDGADFGDGVNFGAHGEDEAYGVHEEVMDQYGADSCGKAECWEE